MSQISVNSSASNKQSVDQISTDAPLIAFSKLAAYDKQDLNYALKALGINCDKVSGRPFEVERLFTPEKKIPSDLLESTYQALLNRLTAYGYPGVDEDEAERSMLLHCVLQVSLQFKF